MLLEYGDWTSGTDASSFVDEIFRAREALAFASLANRDLFSQGFRYCNYHSYTMCLQKFSPGHASTFSFGTRRRDGGTNHLWSNDSFAFQKPEHVVETVKVRFDSSFLNALLNIDPSDDTIWEAIREYNAANTDSSAIPPHVELVMLKSAFEWLFRIEQDWTLLKNAIDQTLSPYKPVEMVTGPLEAEWKKKRMKGSANRILHAWVKEFCDLRGASAHGNRRDEPRFIWSINAHLAFASMLFPLILKAVLKQRGRYEMSKEDIARLRVIDHYIVHDPFDYQRRQGKKSPWAKVEETISELKIQQLENLIIGSEGGI